MISTCPKRKTPCTGIPQRHTQLEHPSEMVRLLKMADEKNLFAPVYRDFLWKTMTETATGSNKLKGLLPSNTVVGHKTGSSDRNLKGVKMADNDAGNNHARWQEVLYRCLRNGLK